MSTQPNPAVRSTDAPQTHFVELWGDIVDTRHLALAIVIGAAVSVGIYLIAGRIFAAIIPTPALAQAYAMLAGLGGCIVSGAICARLFPPKRDVFDEVIDPHWRDEALDQLKADTGSLGDISALPAATQAEIREVGLWESFAAPAASNARGA